MKSTLTINEYGAKYWRINGIYHREGGPAVIFVNGTKLWYFNGERHREDGPAIIYPNGNKFWCLNNIIYSQKEWLNLILTRDLNEIYCYSS